MKKYIIFWLSQAFSQFGSSMTSFALILWAYTQKGSAMTVSLMTFFNFLPYIIASLFAGAFVDNHGKKRIMLACDAIAAACSAFMLVMTAGDSMEIWHIYAVNAVIGLMNAFQGPASAVAIGQMAPKDRLEQVSGMNAFSANLVSVLSPVCAASLFAWRGLETVLAIDLMTFAAAFLTLVFFIAVPEKAGEGKKKASAFAGCADGFRYIGRDRGLMWVIVTMALINFFSRLTYENILSPMILSRSGGDSAALGIVNAAMGIGGIAGGLTVSSGKVKGRPAGLIYISAGLSFLLGDITMGLGRSTLWWAAAGMAASLPIPFIQTGQTMVFYRHVPPETQGRVFAVRNAVQCSTIPLGILLGGYLADYVFEPFMAGGSAAAMFLGRLVGYGPGSGMALMFLCTGTAGTLLSLIFYSIKSVKQL